MCYVLHLPHIAPGETFVGAGGSVATAKALPQWSALEQFLSIVYWPGEC